MPNDLVTFAIDATVAPELAVGARGLAEGLVAAGRHCDVLVDPWPETLAGRSFVIEVGDVDHIAGRWRLDISPRAELELIDPDETSTPLPFAVPSLPDRKPGRRVLFIGGEAGRRTRMMAKTFDALRRRGESTLVVWRSLPDELVRQKFTGEVHADVEGPELMRLLASAAALVEVSDEATTEGLLLAAIGRASGIPTVVHAAVPVPEWDGRLLVPEWSGEAFADAALEATRRSRNSAPAAELRREAGKQLAELLR